MVRKQRNCQAIIFCSKHVEQNTQKHDGFGLLVPLWFLGTFEDRIVVVLHVNVVTAQVGLASCSFFHKLCTSLFVFRFLDGALVQRSKSRALCSGSPLVGGWWWCWWVADHGAR